MDNQNLNTNQQPANNNVFGKLLTRRNIFVVLAVVILGELIWAGSSLLKPNNTTPSPAPVITTTIPVEEPTIISLTSNVVQVKPGDKINVSINITSPKNTQGADIIINFDPKVLSLETVGKKKEPVVLSGMYNEFPINEVEGGKITVSGISTTDGGVATNGLFGTVVFVAKAAGQTKVSIDFTPGSTTDSNVTQIEGGKDALSEVSDLEVKILP